MAGQKVILVTGVGNYWGTRLIKRLLSQERNSQDSDFHVIGLDLEPPQEEIKNFDFIQADVRNPLIVDLLKSEGVDTVCHLAEFSHFIVILCPIHVPRSHGCSTIQ